MDVCNYFCHDESIILPFTAAALNSTAAPPTRTSPIVFDCNIIAGNATRTKKGYGKCFVKDVFVFANVHYLSYSIFIANKCLGSSSSSSPAMHHDRQLKAAGDVATMIYKCF